MHDTAAQNVALADWAQALQQLTIQQLLTVATQPGVLSFAPGLPAAELFPSDAYAETTAHIFAAQSHDQPLMYI
ncbi:hypothetical protein ccbrp13_32650 [Ktedonobacteria bacterium brp13]|nr:hypothetical protein ccbrp13_32650 [Ktedonobacteria bacterium brp13]